MRAARILSAAIRPQAPIKAAAAAAKPNAPARIPGLGLLVLLGGLALASYLARPTAKKPLPPAALDTFKRRISIVFVLGDSNGTAKQFADENKFAYIKVGNDPSAQLQPLVSQGQTRFILEGVPATTLPEFEQNVVESDLVLDFRKDVASDKVIEYLERGRRLEHMDEKHTIKEILAERNLL